MSGLKPAVIKPASSTVASAYRPLGRNKKGEVTDYFEWEEHIEDVAQLLYPEICNELITLPLGICQSINQPISKCRIDF